MSTVIICTMAYNSEGVISQTIDSVLNQTFTDFEYHILNNGSTDKTLDIIHKYAKKDPRIVVHHREKNHTLTGEVFPIYSFIAKLSAQNPNCYLTVIDSDDWWEPNYLERLISFSESQNLDLAITGTMCFDEETQTEYVLRKLDAQITISQTGFAQQYPAFWGFPSTHWGSLMRTNLCCRVDYGNITSKAPHYGIDTVAMLGYLRECARIGIDNSALYHYRIYPQSLTFQYDSNRFNSNVGFFELAKQFLEVNNAFDIKKQNWLKREHLNAVQSTLELLRHADLPNSEKLAECRRIVEHPLTAHVLDLDCEERRTWLIVIQLITLLAMKSMTSDEEAENAFAVLKVIAPLCKSEFRMSVLESLAGALMGDGSPLSEETFLDLFLTLAALENQVPAFLLGKIRLAQFYLKNERIEDCRAVLDDLTEMGAGDHEEVVALRHLLHPKKKKRLYNPYRQQPAPLQAKNEMWEKYVQLTVRGMYCLGSWLKRNHFRRVAIYCKPLHLYGMGFQFGALDKLVISELLKSDGIEIAGLITRTVTTLGNLPILSVESVKNDASIDAILIAEPEIYASALQHFGDRVCFLSHIIDDIYRCQIDMLPMMQLLNELQKKGHKVCYCRTPCAEDIENKSVWEKFVVENNIVAGNFGQDRYPQAFELSGLNKKYNSLAEYNAAVLSNATKAQGFEVKKDYYLERLLVNEQPAQSRFVANSPLNYEQTVYMYGNSAVAGIGLEERDSSPSALQAILNQTGKVCRVLNLGVDGQWMRELTHRIADSKLDSNSVVVVVVCHPMEDQLLLQEMFRENNLPYCDTVDYFQRPHNFGEVFFNAHHLNHTGNRKVAEIIYQKLFVSDSASMEPVERVSFYQPLSERPEIVDEYYDPVAQSAVFRKYIQEISSQRKQGVSNIGAIVMNCNPFTLGHQHIIETCAAQVDWLYVFVVEEDRSVFPFCDRLKLVEQGTTHLPNVGVLPSGSFMISTLTFPEYFRKDDMKELVIDPSADVELFGRYIAPALGITVRFAGEEPLDPITAQYNETMARILPNLGIRFEVLKRKEVDGIPVSASCVRELLSKGEYSEIQKYVPETTMDYLLKRSLYQ